MSTHDNLDHRHHDNDAEHEHDLGPDGIVNHAHHESGDDDFRRDLEQSFEEHDTPSPPARFFMDANSASQTADSETSSMFSPTMPHISISPTMPDISISHADDDSIAHSTSGYESSNVHSFVSEVPVGLQSHGLPDPFATPANSIPPSIRNFSSMHNSVDEYDNDYDDIPSRSNSPPVRLGGGGIATRRPGLTSMYSNPYLPHINSIQFQNSQNQLLGSPNSPMSTPGLAAPQAIPARMLYHQTSNSSLRNALSSPPPRMLHSSQSVPALRSSPRLGHSPSTAYLRPSTPTYGVPRKPVPKLRRQRSTALPDYDEPKLDPSVAKKKKPRYYNPHDSSIPKPWLQHRDRKELWSKLLSYSFILLGGALAGLMCFLGAMNVEKLGNVCLVLDEEFSGSALDNKTWAYDSEMGGFGNGEFEIMTTSNNNTFIEDGILYIVPTLTSDAIGHDAIYNGHTYNLTGCSVSNITACSAISNSTTKTIINPVQSGRIHTKVNGSTTSIAYGKVEVVARLPKGDWLWPAIWMLPVNNTYGAWPVSGEIDLMEARGNNRTYPFQGDNYVRASLNWGPNDFINSVAKTFGWYRERRKSFNEVFHTYTLEWDEDFLRVYIDSRLHKMLDISFKKESFWMRGKYPANAWNGTQEVAITNPWEGSGNNSAPFDQQFYLIMNVAVGGTNGWFPDGAGGKPWLDGSNSAMYDFAMAQDEWYPTWPTDVKSRGMAIDSVKMWQKC